jgi:molecular chaperone GrpE
MTRRDRAAHSSDDHRPTGRTEPSASADKTGVGESMLQERYQRLASDFDNYRKRVTRDAERSATSVKDSLLKEILSINDNLERALATHPSATADQLRGGIEMTHQQLLAFLKRHGVEPDDSIGAPFDPHRHEAISARLVPGEPDHTVVEVVQRGYRRGDDVVRPAQVIINDLELVDRDTHAGGL